MKAYVLELLTGQGPWLPLGTFVLLGAVIFAVASRLARAADAIADATGLGRAWIGVILLAGTTSLPEITTDVNASLLGAPDIGVGDLMGSTLANMLILGMLDMVYARRHILQGVSPNHAIVGLLAITLTVIAGTAISVGGFGRIGHVGIESLLIFAVYLFGMRVFYRMTRATAQGLIPEEPGARVRPTEAARRAGLRDAAWAFGLAAIVLGLIAPLLVISAEAVSAETGMSETFIGTLLVGFTTSFPEIAASVAAVRLGAIDLAVGNIFGSNAFNMCVLLFMDVSYLQGPVVAAVSSEHVLSSQIAVLCMSFGVLGVLGKIERRTAAARVESILIVASYAAGVWLLARD